MGIFDLFRRSPRALPSVAQRPPPMETAGVAPSAGAGVRMRWDDGDKFPGGFGPTELLTADYWTLRARSSQLFEQNMYARGLVRRLITNIINTGLHLEATPEEAILHYEEDGLADWAEDVENRFHLWEVSPPLCHHQELLSFGKLQQLALLEALVAGDVLCVLLQEPHRRLPRLQLISGASVQTPLSATVSGRAKNGNRIRHGVELDGQGRHVAYHIAGADDEGKSRRLPARGVRSGRRQAWLFYGTDKRLDAVRGKPLLSLVLQSLREIDRYRDAVQRKAVINGILAVFIKRAQDMPSSMPFQTGAVRQDTDTAVDNTGAERSFNVAEHHPGLVLDELAPGEEPQGFQSNGTDEKFGDFEAAVLRAIAWANEIPPETLLLQFSSNYSASQAATNEFKMFLNRARSDIGQQFCQPIYEEWLHSQLLEQRIVAPNLLEALRDRRALERVAAWFSADWTGHIKPSVDQGKVTRAYKEQIDECLITRDRAARELTGTKFTKNAKKLRRENQLVAKALEPLGITPADLLKAARPSGAEQDDVDQDGDEDEETTDGMATERGGDERDPRRGPRRLQAS